MECRDFVGMSHRLSRPHLYTFKLKNQKTFNEEFVPLSTARLGFPRLLNKVYFATNITRFSDQQLYLVVSVAPVSAMHGFA